MKCENGVKRNMTKKWEPETELDKSFGNAKRLPGIKT